MSRTPRDFYDIDIGDKTVRMPRVTSITKVVGNKEKLIDWVARTEKDAVIVAAAAAFGAIPPGDRFGTSPIVFESILRATVGTGRANEAVSEGAMEIGNEAHKRLEWVVKGRVGPEPPVSPQAALAVAAGERFLAEQEIESMFAEFTVWSETSGFAGTLDLLARKQIPALARRGLAVVDWKVSKAIYPEARLQVGGYAIAVDEMGHGPVEEGLIVRLPKTTTDPGFELVSLVGDELEAAKAAFLDALGCWNWLQAQSVAYAKARVA